MTDAPARLDRQLAPEGRDLEVEELTDLATQIGRNRELWEMWSGHAPELGAGLLE